MKQRGRNEKYPFEIKTWKLGEPVPQWISDVARVKEIKEDGSVVIDVRKHTNGGFEIIGPENQILIETKNDSDLVCFGSGKFFVLTNKQLDLIYI